MRRSGRGPGYGHGSFYENDSVSEWSPIPPGTRIDVIAGEDLRAGDKVYMTLEPRPGQSFTGCFTAWRVVPPSHRTAQAIVFHAATAGRLVPVGSLDEPLHRYLIHHTIPALRAEDV